MFGPVISGSQFRLRPPRLDEAEVMCTWFEDLEVTFGLFLRFPPSLEAEREWLSGIGTAPDQIIWTVEHEERPVGTTGIHAINWVNQHGTTGTVIGDKAVWGRGIAGELMRLRADFAFSETSLRKLKSGYIDGNEASRRAQLAAGYREVGRRQQEVFRRGRWLDLVDTEMLREDWMASKAGGSS